MIFSLQKLKSVKFLVMRARKRFPEWFMEACRCSALDTISSIEKYISFEELSLKNIGRYSLTHLFWGYKTKVISFLGEEESSLLFQECAILEGSEELLMMRGFEKHFRIKSSDIKICEGDLI